MFSDYWSRFFPTLHMVEKFWDWYIDGDSNSIIIQFSVSINLQMIRVKVHGISFISHRDIEVLVFSKQKKKRISYIDKTCYFMGKKIVKTHEWLGKL